jgi:hypothetical protein
VLGEQEKTEVVDMILAYSHHYLFFLLVRNDVGRIIFTPPLSR